MSLFQLCKKHHFGINKPEKITQSPDDTKFLLKTLTQIKSNVSAPNKKKVKFSTWFYFPKYLVYNSKAVMDDQMEYKDFKKKPSEKLQNVELLS